MKTRYDIDMRKKQVHPHGIASDVINTPISIRRDDSYRRISLTIRHFLPTRRQVSRERDEQEKY
jgi:hypothetical protein